MRLSEWKDKGQYFGHGIHKVFYVEEGSGEALICIHGFPTSSWDWHRMWPELVTRFRVVAPDMLGFGYSDKPDEDVYSIQHQAEFHETFLRCFDIKEVHILAHDYGGSIAQELLARYEDRKKAHQEHTGVKIKSICFLNGGLFPEVHHALLVQKLLISPIGAWVGKLISESTFGRNFAAVFGKDTKPTSQEIGEYWSMLCFNNGMGVSHRIMRYIEERKQMRSRWVGAMQTTFVPMRLINGPDDSVSGAHMASRYQEVVPNPDVVLLKGIGHYPQMEDPNGVLNAFLPFVEKFMARQSAGTGELKR